MDTENTKSNITPGKYDRQLKLIGILLILISFASAWLIMDYRTFAETPLKVSDPGLHYNVPAGASLTHIAKDLADRGIINKPNLLIWMGRLQGKSNKLKAGEYNIAPGTTPEMFLDTLIGGKVVQYAITFIEGWTFKQLREHLSQNPDIVQTIQGLTDEEVMNRIGLPGRNPEGLFLPETYHFVRGTTDIEILKRANRSLEDLVNREWQDRAPDLPYKSEYESLIMASIIEKETGKPEERDEIAGVFVRRLKKHMRLQTDPTVIYGLGDEYDGNLRRRDLQTQNPYNTYMHKGLPPTPIAMPGKAAILAALHPSKGKSLYFVSRGDGSHHFSDTLEAHNKAVIKYQLNGKEKSFSSYNHKNKVTK